MEENTLMVIEDLTYADSYYKVYFTDRRVVAICIRGAPSNSPGVGTGGLVGALIGEGVSRLRDPKWKEKQRVMVGMTLDEKLAFNQKSFSVLYTEVKRLKVNSFGLNRNFTIERNMDGQSYYFGNLTKRDFEGLRARLPQIPVLVDKLELPKK